MIMEMLIENITTQYKDVDAIVLATTEFQRPAIRLYKRFGFREMLPYLQVKNYPCRVEFNVPYFRLLLNRWKVWRRSVHTLSSEILF